jgi:AAA domain
MEQTRPNALRTTPSRVVLVVGIPGAGKTVLIDRAAGSPEWTVLDLDRFRRRLSPTLRRLPVPYPLFVLAIVLAIARKPQVVVESRGTYAWLRRLVTGCARIRSREAIIVLLDASPGDATAGQVRRGRVAPSGVMRLNTTRWTQLRDAAISGRLSAEGWSQVLVLSRAQASAVQDLGELVREPWEADGADDDHKDGVRLSSSRSRRTEHE